MTPVAGIRPIRPAEYRPVGHLLVDAYDAVGAFDDGYRDHLRHPEGWVPGTSATLVAVDDRDTAIGCVGFVLPGDAGFEPIRPPPGDAGLRFLAVAAHAQGQGAGRALVDACIAHGRRRGRRRLVLHSMAFMVGAHRLYARVGFDRREDLDVMFPVGRGLGFTFDLTGDAASHFPPPGPPPDPVPWFVEAWGLDAEAGDGAR